MRREHYVRGRSGHPVRKPGGGAGKRSLDLPPVVRKLRRAGQTDRRIAKKLGVPLADVRAVE